MPFAIAKRTSKSKNPTAKSARTKKTKRDPIKKKITKKVKKKRILRIADESVVLPLKRRKLEGKILLVKKKTNMNIEFTPIAENKVNDNDDYEAWLQAYGETVATLEKENEDIKFVLLEKERLIENSKLERLEVGLKVKDLLNEKKISEVNSYEEIEKIKNKHAEMLEEIQYFREKTKADLEMEHERRESLQEKLKSSSAQSLAYESKLREKAKLLQQEKLKVEKLKEHVVIEQRNEEKSIPDFGKNTAAVLKACIEELQKCKVNKTILLEKEKLMQGQVDQLTVIIESARSQLEGMSKIVANAKEKLKAKDNVFTEQIQVMQEQLSDVVAQASTRKDQLEAAKREASKVEGLRRQAADLTSKVIKNKLAAQESLNRANDAVTGLKVQEEEKLVSEARAIALEAQLQQQSKAADFVRTQWGKMRDVLKEKLEVAISQSSANAKEVFEMKKVVEEKTLVVELVHKQIACLTKDLEADLLSVHDLGTKAEGVENALKLKNEQIVHAVKNQEAELVRHKQNEKASEVEAIALKAKLEKLNSFIDLVDSRLEEKSNALSKTKQIFDELNEKARTSETGNSELKLRVAEMQTAAEKQIKQISEKEAILEAMHARATGVEKKNQILACEISSQKSTFESKIAELERHLSTQRREQERKDHEERQAELEILLRTEQTLLEAQAEIVSLKSRLEEQEAGRKDEEEDHQAEIEGYEGAINEKNETIRDLTVKLSTLKKVRDTSSPGSGVLLCEGQPSLPTSG